MQHSLSPIHSTWAGPDGLFSSIFTGVLLHTGVTEQAQEKVKLKGSLQKISLPLEDLQARPEFPQLIYLLGTGTPPEKTKASRALELGILLWLWFRHC